MSFLSPWYLFGLLAAGIPIAIHLIRREKALRIPFSTVRFLKNAPKQSTFTRRFQQWLLMLMRIAMVALLAVAFARPLISSTASQWIGPAPESAVILIDASMSMGYGDYYDRAKKKALDMLSRINEAAVIVFSDGIDQIKELTTARTELENFLNTLDSPGYGTTRFLPALRLADQMLAAARYPNKTVYLISDFQHHAFQSRDSSWRLSAGVRFEGVQISDKGTANLAITHVNSPKRLIQDKGNQTIRVRIQNQGTQQIPATRVSLMLDGKTVSTQRVDFGDQIEAEVTFPATFRDRGTHTGSVSIEDDRLSADNRHYFATRVSPPINVLCIKHATTPNWYEDDSYWFRLALGDIDRSSFGLTAARPDQFNPAELDAYDVIVLLNIGNLEAAQINGLQAYIERGGNVLISLADRVDDRTFNRQFGKLSPAVLRQKSVRTDQDRLTVTAFNNRHPIFQPLGPIDFNGTLFRDYWPATPVKDSAVLMELDDGAPVFLERSVGKGRVLLFASSLDTKWNNLALQAVYLPMIHETLSYLARREDQPSVYCVGETVPINISTGRLVSIIDPQGRDVGAEIKSGATPFFTGTRVPGFYAIRTTGHKEHIAVNTPVIESNLTPMDPTSLGQMVMNADPKPMQASQAPGAALKLQMEKSQRLWWWLLLLVFILALGETLLANRTYR